MQHQLVVCIVILRESLNKSSMIGQRPQNTQHMHFIDFGGTALCRLES